MKKLILKAIVQKSISFLPHSAKVNFFFQKYVTKGVDLSDDLFFDRLSHARDHLKAYLKSSGQSVPASCVELGTGWYPIVPMALFIAGSEKIYSIDITMHATAKSIILTTKKFIEVYERALLANYLPHIQDDRLAILRDISQMSETTAIETLLKQVRLVYLLGDAEKYNCLIAAWIWCIQTTPLSISPLKCYWIC
jgi:hypothetical protein